MTGTGPLLTLTMMLKNEAATIEATLATVAPFVDRWVIVDTGSTDGTQEIVRRAMKSVPGELVEAPFVDFATTRNFGLEACGEATTFVLWLDADDYLDNGRALRETLRAEQGERGDDRDAYYVRVDVGSATFDSVRVLRSSARWRFRGSVHEVLVSGDGRVPKRRIPQAIVRHRAGDEGAARSRARWERDVELLQRELDRDPKSSRSAFYLGMTLYWLLRCDEAISALDRRIALGGWAEEIFYAKLTKGRAARSGGRPWPEVLGYFLDACSAAPHRAEPLHAIAEHYDATGDHGLAMLFARRGFELPLPKNDLLFIEEATYLWRCADLVGAHAFWLGEFEIGERAARQAVKAKPDDERLKRNLGFYLARKKKA
ncbi:MAG: glycosyltransferase [Polyangiales bacterium]